MPRVICEYCNNRLIAPMSLVGKNANCPACGRIIRIMPGQLSPAGPMDADWHDGLSTPSA